MRSRSSILILLFVISLIAIPVAAHAANTIPFFGPIIPDAQIQVNGVASNQNVCAAGWGMLIIVINNIILLLLTIAIVFVAPLMIAYSGFLFVVNPVNASAKEQAKKILRNTIVGIVIALAGWLIIDALMAVLYNPGAPYNGGTLGKWSDIITSNGELCLPQKGTEPAAVPAVAPPGVAVVPPTADCAASYTSNLPGISVSSSGNCCDRNNSTCTSLTGMSGATLSQIINVKDRCGAITVTGGTEVGHSGEGNVGSHSGGSKVDISQDIIQCILNTTGSSEVKTPSFGSKQAKDSCGNIYTWETNPNHTDIYVKSACFLR